MDAARVGRGASVRKLRGTADMSSAVDVGAIYKRRFTPDLASRQQMWQVLCQGFFHDVVPHNATVREVGAGHFGFSKTLPRGPEMPVRLRHGSRHYAQH